jgi:hypothetical protein
MSMSAAHPGRAEIVELNTEDTIRRWPRIVAHVIAESLGYFTPEGAANALLHLKSKNSHSPPHRMKVAAG